VDTNIKIVQSRTDVRNILLMFEEFKGKKEVGPITVFLQRKEKHEKH
jgi:hypothetical protein